LKISAFNRKAGTDLGSEITTSIDVDASFELELSNAPLVTLVTEKKSMKNNNSSNIMKNVRSGIMAFLGCLVVDFNSSE
jgi:hypothetical protein